MWRKLSGLILRYRFLLITALVIVTAFMSWRAMHVQLSYERVQILPADDSDYISYTNFKKVFGEDGSVLVIGFNGDSLFRLKQFNEWYDLGDSIKHIDGIQEVVSVARSYYLLRNDSMSKLEFKPLFAAKPGTQEELDNLHAIFNRLPFYEGLIFNKESKATIMAITFDQVKLNQKDRIGMVAKIKELADAYALSNHITMHYSGLPYIRTAITKKVLGEMELFIVLALLVSITILFIFFRNFNAVIFSMIVVLFGVVWLLGTTEMFGYKITILTSLIPPLLIVIGIPNCILLLNKYQQEFSLHGNKIKALSRTIERIGPTTFLANITTAIGFFVFYFTRSRAMMEFGLIASINVMLTYLISLVFIPIVFSFLPPPSARHTKHLQSKIITFLLRKVELWVHKYRPRIYMIVIAAVIISLVGMMKITAVGFVVDDLPKKDVIYTDLKYFENNFHGVLPFEIEIDTRKPKGAVNIATLRKINLLQKKLAQYKEFSQPVSVAQGIKFSYQALNDNDPKYFITPSNFDELQRLSDYAALAKENQKMLRSFIDSTKQLTRVSVQMADVGSIRMKEIVKALKPKIDSIFDPKDYDTKITGSSLVFLNGNDYLLVNLKESVFLAIGLIGALMFLLFMSLRMSVISMVPSLVPLLITAGIMGYCGIALKPSTILIFSIAFGIASDGTMYFLTKYRQELRLHNRSISKTVSVTIAERGVSMIYTAVVLFCGFFIFVASDFGGTQALGILISVTLLIAMASNLIFLPAMLMTLERRLISRAFLKEPLFDIYDEEDDVDKDKLEIENHE